MCVRVNIVDFAHAITDNLDKRRNLKKNTFVIQNFFEAHLCSHLSLKKIIAAYLFVSSCVTKAFIAFRVDESEFCRVYVY